jgi:hypothetical protein
MSYPFFTTRTGKNKGVIQQFTFVTLEEFERIGLTRSIKLEYGRKKSQQVSADPSLKFKWTTRRAERRRTEMEMRARENELRRRRRQMTQWQ